MFHSFNFLINCGRKAFRNLVYSPTAGVCHPKIFSFFRLLLPQLSVHTLLPIERKDVTFHNTLFRISYKDRSISSVPKNQNGILLLPPQRLSADKSLYVPIHSRIKRRCKKRSQHHITAALYIFLEIILQNLPVFL